MSVHTRGHRAGYATMSRVTGSGRLRTAARSYFGTAVGPPRESIRSSLWADGGVPAGEDGSGHHYLVLEQYKLYVEMADRVSARRGLTNTFFLTLNTAIFTVVGIAAQHSLAGHRWLLVVPWLVLVLQCLTWFWLLRSYRQLNAAKYVVVGLLEEQLPASPYWRAEWTALGEGTNPTLYWPMSHIEQWVPALFAIAYTAGFISLLLS
jgi:hypothetical protein